MRTTLIKLIFIHIPSVCMLMNIMLFTSFVSRTCLFRLREIIFVAMCFLLQTNIDHQILPFSSYKKYKMMCLTKRCSSLCLSDDLKKKLKVLKLVSCFPAISFGVKKPNWGPLFILSVFDFALPIHCFRESSLRRMGSGYGITLANNDLYHKGKWILLSPTMFCIMSVSSNVSLLLSQNLFIYI